MTTMFRRLPVLADLRSARAHQPIPKGPSRLAVKTQKDKADVGKLEQWKRAVFALDKFRCRKCGRKVMRTLERSPQQAQAHHVAGRSEQLVRYDVRNGLTVCAVCHDQLTGAVDEKWIVRATKMFLVAGMVFTNAREKVTFQQIAGPGPEPRQAQP